MPERSRSTPAAAYRRTGWGRGPGTWTAQWANVRKIVIARDGTTCRHCGTTTHTPRCNPRGCGRCLVVGHHPIAKADGGPDHPDNAIAICRDCNLRGPAIRNHQPPPPTITPPQW